MGLLDHKKHLLVLFASPHAHGSTRMLLESFLDVFKEKKDWDIKEVDLYEQPPHPCVGCGLCEIGRAHV